MTNVMDGSRRKHTSRVHNDMLARFMDRLFAFLQLDEHGDEETGQKQDQALSNDGTANHLRRFDEAMSSYSSLLRYGPLRQG